MDTFMAYHICIMTVKHCSNMLKPTHIIILVARFHP